MREQTFPNQGGGTLEVHTQLRNPLNKSESEKAIINHPLIHRTLIISVMNAMVRNQLRASDVDWRIILLQVVQNRTLRIIKSTGTWKSLKLVYTDQRK